MYLPAHFVETEASAVKAVIDHFPLATIICSVEGSLIANHLPLIMHNDQLIGHIALANDMHQLIKDGSETLTIFTGEDSYISPNWYPSKQENHQQVPTWNYQIVHIQGRIFFSHDDKEKRAIVARLTNRFEKQTNGDQAWKMSDAPADFIQDKIDNIVSFRIEITQTIAKSKLGQNKSKSDFDQVAKHLAENDKKHLVKRMHLHQETRDKSEQ